MLCGRAPARDGLRRRGAPGRRRFLLGAAANLPAVRTVAPRIFGTNVVVPQPAEYAALGAARQAAWAMHGQHASRPLPEPPRWRAVAAEPSAELTEEDIAIGQAVRQQFTAVREQTHPGAFG
jgi:xylulokinase